MKNFKTTQPLISISLSFLIAAFLFINQAYALDSLKKAPAINFSACLNHTGLKKDFYKNKYLVLDFWATWCGPCIASFPHLDSLSRKFSSDSVVFAIMSSEEKGKVSKFLSRRNIKALYLVDSITAASRTNARINELYGLTAQSFGVQGIPHTIIIDKNNNLVWESQGSRDLNEYVLYNVIHNDGAAVTHARDIAENNQLSKKQQKADIFKLIRKDTLTEQGCTLITAALPYSDYSMSANVDSKKQMRYLEVGGRPLEFYYNYFTHTPFNRIKNSSGLNSIFVHLEGSSAIPVDNFYKIALDLLCKAYHLQLKKSSKQVDCYDFEVVNKTIFDTQSQPLQEASSHHSSSDETDSELVFSNFYLKDITRGLEDYLSTPVLLGNNTNGQLRCDMTIKKGNISDLNLFLVKKYGVRLAKTKHLVEFAELI